ncbi:hypothetical protein JCM11491_002504 [Sporobolomyces phaffii]
MPRDASRSTASQPPTPYASTGAATGVRGEWDSPRATVVTQRDRTPGSTRRSTARAPTGELVRASDYTPAYSKYKQEILSEEEYITNLSEIIKRDFFPQLHSLDTRRDIIRGLESDDARTVEESVRRMRELCTPVALSASARRRRVDDTPGRTPFDSTYGADTPTAFDRTPASTPARPLASSSRVAAVPPRIDPSLSLDAFQSKYTSEDNSSFATLLARDNQLRREKTRWAWDAERRANDRLVRGRRQQERLVDVTRDLIGDGDGVWVLEGGRAGRPGERQVLVGKGTDVGGSEGEARGLLLVGRDEKERLKITNGTRGDQKLILDAPQGDVVEGGSGAENGKGKGKQVARIVDERAKQFVDWDRPAVEEEEANKPIDGSDLQVGVGTWPFKNRNSLMFPPDADTDPSDPPPPSSTATGSGTGPKLPMGEPKGIRYHATRLMEVEKGGFGAGSETGTPSPTRSRINAAIAGTPYPAATNESATPRVNNFSFVSALPTPRAHQLAPEALQELMTWGSIEATPVTIRTNARDDHANSVGPFRIEDTSRREALAHKMAKKAKRSLAESAAEAARANGRGGGGGLALDARRTGGTSLRRGVLDSLRTTPGTPGGGSATPRTGDHLSPAARSLLSKTKPGRMLDRGLRGNQVEMTKEDKEKEEERRLERARKRAREVESQDRLKRERWTPSPAVSLGFDPDFEEQRFLPKHGKAA